MSDSVISFSGQIEPETIAQIAEQGFKSIINNRPDLEGGAAQPLNADIQSAAEAAKLNYAYQPVISGQVSQQDVEQFAALYNQLEKPILAFCRSGTRSNGLYQLCKQMDLLDDD